MRKRMSELKQTSSLGTRERGEGQQRQRLQSEYVIAGTPVTLFLRAAGTAATTTSSQRVGNVEIKTKEKRRKDK